MNKPLLYAAIVGVCALTTPVTARELAERLVDVQASFEEGAAPKIFFHLANRTNRTLRIWRSELPWGTAHSTVIVAVKLNGLQTLERAGIFDDPGPEVLEIKPGTTISGSVDMAQVVKDLNGARANSDVLVFWSYEFREQGAAAKSPRISGSFVIEGGR